MKRWGWILVAALVLLGVSFAWFWSLAAIAPQDVPNVTLRVERAPVQVRLANETAFRDGASGMTLAAGSVVRTGEGGRAVIVFFDQAESRLDANSEATVGEATSDDGGTTVRLDLGLGRVWSRVLRLFDLDSSFSVKTSSVVATVRGTAFDVRAHADGTAEVWVSESAVTVVPAGQDGRLPDLPEGEFRAVTSTPVITAGQSAGFKKDGTSQWRKPIPAEDRASSWFTENRTADELFLRDARERRRVELDGQPHRAVEGLTRLSERLHLAVARGVEADTRASVYAARRLAGAIALAEAGRTGAASQVFARFETDAEARLMGANAERERKVLSSALERVMPLLDDLSPSSPLYPFKQRVEDLAVEAAQADDASVLFARLRTTDARLDEAARLLDAGTLEEAATALEAAHGGLENARRDASAFLAQLEGPRKNALGGKLFALVARDAAERSRLEIALRADPIAATSTTDIVPTSPSIVPVRPSAPIVEPEPTGVSLYSGIGLYVQPNPIDPGATAKLSALATRVGGGTEDVTSRTAFRIVSGAGSLSGLTFTAATPGTTVFEATFTDQGKKMISRAALTVNGALATLDRITVAATARIASGASSPLSATAYYSNGFQQDVTGKVVWKNLMPTLGVIAGNTFTAGAQAVGVAEIEATYSEGGVTKSQSVIITIVAPAQMYRNN